MIHKEPSAVQHCRNPPVAVSALVFVEDCYDFFLLQYICLGKVAASYEPRYLVA